MIAICIMLGLIILGILKPKSKIVFFMITIYMWLFYAFNSYSGDGEVYQYVYEEMQANRLLNHFEAGYTLLSLIAIKLGLSFREFRVMLATIYIVLLDLTVNKYTEKKALVLALYMVFPFTYFVSVLRAGISSLIVMFGVQYIVNDKKSYECIKFVLCILLATLFHSSSIIFILLLCVKTENKNIQIALVLSSFIIACLYRTGAMYTIAKQVVSNERILQWFLGGKVSVLNWKGQLLTIVIIFLIIGMTYLLKKQIDAIAISNNNLMDNFQYSLFKLTYRMDIMFIALIPFSTQSDVWIRIVWEFYLMNICVWVNTYDYVCTKNTLINRKLNFKDYIIGICLISTHLLLFIYSIYPYIGTKNSFIYMFFNNYVFQLFPF